MIQKGLVQFVVLCMVYSASDCVVFTGCYVIDIQNTISETLNGTYEFREDEPKCNDRFIYKATTSNTSLYLYYSTDYWVVYDSWCNKSGIEQGYLRCEADDEFPTHVNGPWAERVVEINNVGWMWNYDVEIHCLDASGLTTTEIIAISITFGVGSLLLLAAIVYDYKHGRFVCPKKKKTEMELAGGQSVSGNIIAANNMDMGQFPDDSDLRPRPGASGTSLYDTFRQAYYDINRDDNGTFSNPDSTSAAIADSGDVTDVVHTNQAGVTTQCSEVSEGPPPDYVDVMSDAGMTLYKSTVPPPYAMLQETGHILSPVDVRESNGEDIIISNHNYEQEQVGDRTENEVVYVSECVNE